MKSLPLYSIQNPIIGNYHLSYIQKDSYLTDKNFR